MIESIKCCIEENKSAIIKILTRKGQNTNIPNTKDRSVHP